MSNEKDGHNAHEASHDNEQSPFNELAVNDFPAHTNAEHPPDGGYGWICVAACFNINCFTWGVVAVRPRKPNAASK
ncbi:hypothetical protein V490_00131 [Pseudogymnoascus sp. VKM F-3557]|nr:hypothetical protein V490_00131 [Pseudogymnoascus sp. VKM F-3557]